MVRETFHHELDKLIGNVLIMGSMVEKAISHAVDSFANLSMEMAKQVIEGDDMIDQKRFEIEESCLRLIATQQPMAGDLRIIISTTHLATNLERMGDYAAGIAEINLALQANSRLQTLADITRMADIGIDILHESLKAFVDRDSNKAREIALRDDEVDSLYHKVLSKCISAMVEDPRNVPVATRIIWVAHKLERISDRVTNICEQVIFAATGAMEELDSD